MVKYKALGVSLLFCLSSTALADIEVPVNLVNDKGVGESIGQITVSKSTDGLVFTPELNGLSPGLHGFHLHQNASCDAKEKNGERVPALAAGSHYDPMGMNQHGTPWGEGHLGDLPALYVDENGKANHPVLAPRLKMAYLKGRSLIIHQGEDNYSDQTGGARQACGVIP